MGRKEMKLKLKEGQEPLWDKDSVKNVIKQIQKGIKVPYADGLGLGALSRRDEHPTIIGKISLDKKSDWPNGILENSRWALVTIYPNGVIDTVRINGYGNFKERKKVPVLRKSKNKDLRQSEKEAYLKGNMCFRDWEDVLKQSKPTIYNEFRINNMSS